MILDTEFFAKKAIKNQISFCIHFSLLFKYDWCEGDKLNWYYVNLSNKHTF